MATLTKEQIEQKKQQLKQLVEEAKLLKDELVEAGAIELSEDDLDKAAGGIRYADQYEYKYNPSRKDDGTGPSNEQLQAQQEYMNNHPHKFLNL